MSDYTLSNASLINFFGERVFKKGSELVDLGHVISSDLSFNDCFDEVSYSAQIINGYYPRIEFELSGGDLNFIDQYCNCRSPGLCEHTAAAIIHKEKSKLLAKTDRWEDWLDSFENDQTASSAKDRIIKEPSNDESFLIYRLFKEKHREDSPDLTVHISRILQNGLVGKGGASLSLDSYYLAENSESDYSRFIAPEDREILDLFKASYLDDQRPGLLTGYVGNMMVHKLIKTKRLYVGDSRSPVSFSNHHFSPKFTWESVGHTMKRLSSNLKFVKRGCDDSGDFYLLNTDPVLVLNCSKNLIHEMDPSIDKEKLSRLMNPPDIPAEQVASVHRKLADSFPIAIEVPDGLNQKDITEPATAFLHIFEDKDSGGVVRHLYLQFKYGRHKINFHPYGATTTVYFYNVPNIVNRDLRFEQESIETLRKLGFKSSNIGNKLIFEIPDHFKRQEAMQKWRVFLTKDIDNLREAGWDVVFDKGFNLEFAPSSDITAETKKSNDWFSLSFDFEFNGEKQSLVPHVSQIIEEIKSFDSLPDEILVEIKPGKFVPVKTDKLLPFIEVIKQLFDLREKDGSLKVKTYNAHLIAGLDQKVTWKGDKEILELGEKILSFDGIKPIRKPKFIDAKLRDYQRDGGSWLNFLNEHGFSGILADDMGLGKSLQTLLILEFLKSHKRLTGPSLLVVPTSLVDNWGNEINKFCKSLTFLKFVGIKRGEMLNRVQDVDVVISTYRLIFNDLDFHKKAGYDYIIVDEAQMMKNPKTQTAQSICSIPAKNRLALSGTPIENHLGELWSLFHFLMPGFLQSKSQFKKHFQTPIEKHDDEERHDQLKRRIRPFILRRLKSDVAKELPKKTTIVKYISFDKKQAEFYESVRMAMNKKVADAVSKKGLNRSHINVLEAIMKLRQACCHPPLIDMSAAKAIDESAKLNFTLDMIDEILHEGGKILVFSFFQSMLKVLSSELDKKEVSHSMLIGETSAKKRSEAVNSFNSGSNDIFLISLKAGGTGLNLPRADTVIHYDPWWNPAVEEQATDRAHRIGQENQVFVYKLICKGSIEEKILELQEKKRRLQSSIYSGGVSKSSDIVNTEELRELLKPIDAN